MDHKTHTRALAGDGGGTDALRAWALSKKELRAEFGEGVYHSYIEQLDFAVEEAGEWVFLARDGGTQAVWLNEKAKDAIVRRMNAHTHMYRPIRICVSRELSQAALDAVRSRRLEAVAEAPIATPAQTRAPYLGTFETLCVGPTNSKAVMLGRTVAARGADLRMVLFRGEPGVGKTLLVESIANAAVAQVPDLKVRLINGQRFTEDFVDALSRKKDPSAFKAWIREADILIIDDVPRVAGRKATEEELYDSIIAVHERGGFVVLTAVAGQSGVSGFGDRLAHHLKCATECEIALPDEELRRNILDMRVRTYQEEHPGFSIEPDALDMIAARMPVSGRELDGAVRQLMVEWLETRTPVTLETADAALRSRISDRERKVTVDMIKAAVARHYDMSVPELLRKTREKAVSHPRQVAMYLSTRLTTLSLPNIARLYGGYDHTTVLYAKRKVAAMLDKSGELAADVESILKLLRNPPEVPPGKGV